MLLATLTGAALTGAVLTLAALTGAALGGRRSCSSSAQQLGYLSRWRRLTRASTGTGPGAASSPSPSKAAIVHGIRLWSGVLQFDTIVRALCPRCPHVAAADLKPCYLSCLACPAASWASIPVPVCVSGCGYGSLSRGDYG